MDKDRMHFTISIPIQNRNDKLLSEFHESVELDLIFDATQIIKVQRINLHHIKKLTHISGEGKRLKSMG